MVVCTIVKVYVAKVSAEAFAVLHATHGTPRLLVASVGKDAVKHANHCAS